MEKSEGVSGVERQNVRNNIHTMLVCIASKGLLKESFVQKDIERDKVFIS